MNMINVSDIVIPKRYKRSYPKKEKMDSIRAYVAEHRKLDVPIVLDGKTLVDNYVRYLVARQYGFREVPCITIEEYLIEQNKFPITCVVGVFENNEKEYVWRINNGITVDVGDMILVKSKCKDGVDTAIVSVVDVFISEDPKMLKHKPVIKKVV